MQTQLIAFILFALQLGNVFALRLSSASSHLTRIAIISDVASSAACLGLCPLIFLEHSRSIQPSTLAILFLLLSATCDAGGLGSLIYNGTSHSLFLISAKLFVELLLLTVECEGKSRILRSPYNELPPEQTAGILNRVSFFWINSLLLQGSSKILSGDELPSIDAALRSELLQTNVLRAWDQRGQPFSST